MLSIALQQLKANISRFVATLVAIAIGVAFLTAGTMVTNSIENSLGGEIDRQYAAVDAAIGLAGSGSEEEGFLRGDAGLTAEQFAALARVDGVADVAAQSVGQTRFADQRAIDDARESTFGVALLAVRIWDDGVLSPVQLVEGRAPTAQGEVTLDRGTAEDRDLAVGDVVRLASIDATEHSRVVGITRFGTSDAPDPSGTVTATTSYAFRLAGRTTETYPEVLVAGEAGVPPAQLVSNLTEAVPPGFRVIDGQQFRDDAKGNFVAVLSILRPVLQGFSGLAIFVCGFVILNTFNVIVGQRTRELALMRAVAATPRQVRRSLRVEGLGIGLLGSVLGLALGVLLTILLSQVLVWLDLDLPAASISLTPGIVITGLLVGTVVTFLASLLPAFRAGRTAPVAAMREAAIENGRVGKLRMGTALTLLVGGVLLMLWGNPWALGFGALSFAVGVFLVGPALTYGFARATRPLFTALGMAGRLSSDNIARQPKRTSTTMNALVLGLLLVTLVTVAGTSLKRTAVDTVNEFSSADFSLTAISGTLPDGLADEIEAIPGVNAVARLRSIPVTYDGNAISLSTADPAQLDEVGIRGDGGSLADIGDGVAMAPFSPGQQVGSAVTFVDQLGRPITLQITVMLEPSIDTYTLGGLVSPETLDRYAPSAGAIGETGLLITASDRRFDEIGQRIQEMTIGYGNLFLLEGNFFGRIIESIFDFLINAVNGLLGMSVVIALIGIVNTLTLSIFERRRELGLLRAVGMTVASVRRMIRLEALQMSVLGTVVGMSAGTLLAWLLLRTSDLSEMDIDWTRFGILFGLGIAIGLVAAIAPTRRVTKMNVLDAISVE